MEKHDAAAAWIEAQAGERVEDFAEVLAHHYVTGLVIAQKVGQADRYEQMRDPAVRYLLWAGDHAMRLDVAAAEDHYARAAELAQDNGRRRAAALVKWAEALHARNRDAEVVPILKDPVALLRQCDDHVQLALALTALSRARHYTAGQSADDPVIEAVELVRDDASPESLGVLAYAALHLAIQEEDWEGGVQMADRALAISAELGLGVDVRALGARASARCHAGDRGGIDDFRQAIDEALDRGLTLEACHLQTNLAISETWWVGPTAQISGLTQALLSGGPVNANYQANLACDLPRPAVPR